MSNAQEPENVEHNGEYNGEKNAERRTDDSSPFVMRSSHVEQ